jgi:menaquinone-dependent protoporphyrinogen IX oxidase
MNGAIFYSTKYGSTEQYVKWISEETGLPFFNIRDYKTSLSNYDYLILGSPIIYHKVHFHKWVKDNLSELLLKPVILFTVSGARAGAKLNGWISDSLPAELIAHMEHVVLLGRQNPKDLNWYDRMMLIVGSMKNPDPVASKEELKGFDFMDRSSIKKVLNLAEKYEFQELPG